MKFLHLNPLVVLGGVVLGAILIFICIAYWMLG